MPDNSARYRVARVLTSSTARDAAWLRAFRTTRMTYEDVVQGYNERHAHTPLSVEFVMARAGDLADAAETMGIRGETLDRLLANPRLFRVVLRLFVQDYTLHDVLTLPKERWARVRNVTWNTIANIRTLLAPSRT